jgi:putative phosphoribosyl transferase
MGRNRQNRKRPESLSIGEFIIREVPGSIKNGSPCQKHRFIMIPFVKHFRDRSEAGQELAGKLTKYADRDDVMILALPRGGVTVGFELAKALHAPLDIIVVRKLGVPGHEELAMGAIAPGNVRVIDASVVQRSHISSQTIDAVAAREQVELERREQVYRGNAPRPDIRGQSVILVDDGLATGSTMRAAIAATKRNLPARLVVAVPTAPPSTVNELSVEVDEVVACITPQLFFGVGEWYEQFGQISDEEVCLLLQRAREADFSQGAQSSHRR